MSDWIDWLRQRDPREPAALITILAADGSTPRGAGTRMLVTAMDATGTVGGGQLEYRATEQARLILSHPPGTWRIQDYPLGPLLGQCCGGRVRLLVEHLDPDRLAWLGEAAEGRVLKTRLAETHVDRWVDAASAAAPDGHKAWPEAGTEIAERIGLDVRPLYLFGAGHVGRAVVEHSEGLPLHLCWFDTRPSVAASAGAALLADQDVERCVGDAPEEASILIMTHDHGLDYRLTRAALKRSPLAFTGLIGSVTKRARFAARLSRDGIHGQAIARLHCPIGIEGIAGKEPAVIAISVLAQLLRLRD